MTSLALPIAAAYGILSIGAWLVDLAQRGFDEMNRMKAHGNE